MKKWKSLSSYARTNTLSYGIILIAYAILMPLHSAGKLSNSMSGILVPICTYIVLAVSLNLTVGVLGELSLGHAGFMSVGAFSGVIAAASLQDIVTSAPLRLLIAIVIGGVLAGVAGLLIGIPVLRLRGDYLAIVTLAFGEIIKNLINCLYVGIDKHGLHISLSGTGSLGMEGGRNIISGPQGAVGVTKIATFTAAVILILFTLFVVINMMHSRTGRAITAIRDNRIAAESVGIGITRFKLTAFITSAALAGMAGALYAMNYSTVAARKFDFNTSILILVFVVLGGMGNIVGSIIATAVLYMLPEVLRPLSNYRMLIYAIVLILVMLLTNSQTVKTFQDRIVDCIKQILHRPRGKSERGESNE